MKTDAEFRNKFRKEFRTKIPPEPFKKVEKMVELWMGLPQLVRHQQDSKTLSWGVRKLKEELRGTATAQVKAAMTVYSRILSEPTLKQYSCFYFKQPPLRVGLNEFFEFNDDTLVTINRFPATWGFFSQAKQPTWFHLCSLGFDKALGIVKAHWEKHRDKLFDPRKHREVEDGDGDLDSAEEEPKKTPAPKPDPAPWPVEVEPLAVDASNVVASGGQRHALGIMLDNPWLLFAATILEELRGRCEAEYWRHFDPDVKEHLRFSTKWEREKADNFTLFGFARKHLEASWLNFPPLAGLYCRSSFGKFLLSLNRMLRAIATGSAAKDRNCRSGEEVVGEIFRGRKSSGWEALTLNTERAKILWYAGELALPVLIAKELENWWEMDFGNVPSEEPIANLPSIAGFNPSPEIPRRDNDFRSCAEEIIRIFCSRKRREQDSILKMPVGTTKSSGEVYKQFVAWGLDQKKIQITPFIHAFKKARALLIGFHDSDQEKHPHPSNIGYAWHVGRFMSTKHLPAFAIGEFKSPTDASLKEFREATLLGRILGLQLRKQSDAASIQEYILRKKDDVAEAFPEAWFPERIGTVESSPTELIFNFVQHLAAFPGLLGLGIESIREHVEGLLHPHPDCLKEFALMFVFRIVRALHLYFNQLPPGSGRDNDARSCFHRTHFFGDNFVNYADAQELVQAQRQPGGDLPFISLMRDNLLGYFVVDVYCELMRASTSDRFYIYRRWCWKPDRDPFNFKKRLAFVPPPTSQEPEAEKPAPVQPEAKEQEQPPTPSPQPPDEIPFRLRKRIIEFVERIREHAPSADPDFLHRQLTELVMEDQNDSNRGGW